MTTQVTITNEYGSHSVKLRKVILPMSCISEDIHVEDAIVLNPGDSHSYYIWGNQKIVIEETPIADEDHST